MLSSPDLSSLIRAIDTADSADSMLDAVEALADAVAVDAIPTLIQVLSFNNPGAAVASVDGLVRIGEPAVKPLLELMDGYNYTARSWAVRALAGIGDPRGLDILIYAATSDISFSVRRAAAKGLGNIDWSLVSSEKVIRQSQQALEALILSTQDGEWVVRYAAVVGLQQIGQWMLSQQSGDRQPIVVCLNQLLDVESELAVKMRARLALEVI